MDEQGLLRVHGVNETEGVSEDDFVRICPSLIHQLYKGACNQEKHQTGEVEEGATDKMLHGKLYDLCRRVKLEDDVGDKEFKREVQSSPYRVLRFSIANRGFRFSTRYANKIALKKRVYAKFAIKKQA